MELEGIEEKLSSGFWWREKLKQLQAIKVLLLYPMYEGREGSNEKIEFIPYMECTHPLDKVDDPLRCVCLRWRTEDRID